MIEDSIADSMGSTYSIEEQLEMAENDGLMDVEEVNTETGEIVVEVYSDHSEWLSDGESFGEDGEIIKLPEAVKTLDIALRVATNIQEDYEIARINIKDAIEKGAGAIEELAQLATALENPRAYEVLGNYVKGVVDMNLSLLDVSSAVSKSVGISAPEQVTNIQDNSVYIGSTEDLQRMFEDGIE